VVKFVVGLSSQAAEEVASSGLLVIKQRKAYGLGNWFQPNLAYQLTLIEECQDMEAKMSLARALLTARITVHDDEKHPSVNNRGSHQLLGLLDPQQQVTFMKRAYECEATVGDDGLTVESQTSKDRHCIWDSYMVEYTDKHGGKLQMEDLNIDHCQLPIHMLGDAMDGVRRLWLYNCTLCQDDDPYSVGDKPAKRRQPLTNQSIHDLCMINGLSGYCQISKMLTFYSIFANFTPGSAQKLGKPLVSAGGTGLGG
jgi:hypothetical protein